MKANAGAKLAREITNYFAAETFYKDHAKRGRDAKLGHNTRVLATERVTGTIEHPGLEKGYAIVLHQTPILTFWEGGTATLRSGGYRTATTKARLNEVLRPIGITLWQDKGEWWIAEFGDEGRKKLKFFDGMEIRVEFNHAHSFRSKGFLQNASHAAFDVFLRGKEIDTVFYSPGDTITAEEVKRSLVEDDGYDSAIVVKKRRRTIRANPAKRGGGLKAATYGYRINHDERGEFRADVIEDDGHVLYSVETDTESGEISDVVDGWMRHARDLVGLTAHLVNLGIIARGSRVVSMPEAERAWK